MQTHVLSCQLPLEQEGIIVPHNDYYIHACNIIMGLPYFSHFPHNCERGNDVCALAGSQPASGCCNEFKIMV